MAKLKQARAKDWVAGLRTVASAVALAMGLGATPTAWAQTLTVLHEFMGGADGYGPEAMLTMDRAGNLYGTATLGGNSSCYFAGNEGCGTVFKLTHKPAGWLFGPLYVFGGGNDGSNPLANVTVAADGTLYGTTDAGGGGSCRDYQGTGCGTVFRLQPPPITCASSFCSWHETVLYRFTGGTDGNDLRGGVVLDGAGTVYGTAAAGGEFGGGLAFQLTRSGSGWTKSAMHSFGSGTDGSALYAGLTAVGDGSFYGTTAAGGTGAPICGSLGCGTVFELTPSGQAWAENILYNFQGSSDGAGPEAPLITDPAGNLYGTTISGTAFELTPSNGNWTVSPLYSFYFGGLPALESGLARDAAGNLYGTTLFGGDYVHCVYGCGTVYKLSPNHGGWTYTLLYEFTNGNDGANPIGGVVVDGSGNLYGTAYQGGTDCNIYSAGCGTVWELTP